MLRNINNLGHILKLFEKNNDVLNIKMPKGLRYEVRCKDTGVDLTLRDGDKIYLKQLDTSCLCSQAFANLMDIAFTNESIAEQLK